jgi:hypothetical protein
MLNYVRLIGVGVLCVSAASAEAQTFPARTFSNTPRVFLDLPLAADVDDAHSASTRVPGATWGTGLGLGLDWGRSGVEIAVGVPQWHVKNFDPQRYRYAGSTYRWQQQGHSYESRSTSRRRSVDVMAMYRANRPIHQRITLSWLVGGGYVYRPEQFTSVTNEVLPDGQLAEVDVHTTNSFRNYMAAAARLDLEFRVAPHVFVVPRLRVTAFPSLLDDSGLAPRQLIARPEIAVRWGF